MHPRDYQPRERVPGTVYRVVRLIGAGGMGTVYEVEDTTIGKSYVLKTLHPQLGSRDDLARRMQDEARTLARLNHPNIVEVITAGITADDMRLPYYVMERLNGQSLRSILTKKGRLDLAHVYHIGIDLLDALDHAHDKGVIHRDVKPDNIFLHRTAAGVTVTKLLDFGIVSMLDGGRNETAGRFLGTLRYAAPEQLRGDKPSPRTDVYAAALVIYEMVAGRGPFDAEGDSQKIGSAHLHKAPPSVTKHVTVPKELDSLLLAALSKSPDARPRDAFSFAASLRNLERMEGSPPRSMPPQSGSRPSSRSASKPAPPPRPPPPPQPRSEPRLEANRSSSTGPRGVPRPNVRPASVTVPLSLVSPSHGFAPPPMTPLSAMSPLGAIPSTGTSPMAAPFITPAPLAPSTPPTSFPRTTLRGMSVPTGAPSLASPFATATATSVDAVDRGAPTHSLVFEGPPLFRPRTEGDPSFLSSVPTFVPTTSAPAEDTAFDAAPPGSAAPPESGLGRSMAPHIRSLAAAPASRVPWGAIAASAVGFAGLAVLAIVAFTLRHTASATSIPPAAGIAAQPSRDRSPDPRPVVTLPAPTLEPDSLEGVAEPPLLRVMPPPVDLPPAAAPPRPVDPAASVTTAPAPAKAASAVPKARSRPASTAPSATHSSPVPRSAPGDGGGLRDRPGPGF
jgi:serine/threonine protein kinase